MPLPVIAAGAWLAGLGIRYGSRLIIRELAKNAVKKGAQTAVQAGGKKIAQKSFEKAAANQTKRIASDNALRTAPYKTPNKPGVNPGSRPPGSRPAPYKTPNKPGANPGSRPPGSRPASPTKPNKGPDPKRTASPSPSSSPKPSRTPSPKTKGSPRKGGGRAEAIAQAIAALALLVDAAKSQLAALVPSITNINAVSATGFKNVPTRTVLHYCLAAAFGMQHQSRLGHVKLTAKVHPVLNRVEVLYQVTSTNLGEIISYIVDVAGPAAAPGSRNFGVWENRAGGVTAFNVQPGVQIASAKDTATKLSTPLGSFNRRSGPGGIWDMAPESYHAGDPPFLVGVSDIEPYTSFYKRCNLLRPMLTRLPALNPQMPDEHGAVGGRGDPSRPDLRTLVAQAFCDPGVRPPTPDTNVYLGTGVLS
jgi:hypothetical protein